MNTFAIFGLIIILIVIGLSIFTFIKLPREAKIANVKEWLKIAVFEAEKYFGGGTGQLKLRYVYDLAIKQFPWLITLITFELFDEWVKEALIWMEDQIEKNPRMKAYVGRE